MTRSGAPPVPFMSAACCWSWCRTAGSGFRSMDPCESARFRHSWILWSNESSPRLRLLACVLAREQSSSPPLTPQQSADFDRLWCSRAATGGGDDVEYLSALFRRPSAIGGCCLQGAEVLGMPSCSGDCSSNAESLPESKLSVLPICKTSHAHAHTHARYCLSHRHNVFIIILIIRAEPVVTATAVESQLQLLLLTNYYYNICLLICRTIIINNSNTLKKKQKKH